MMVKPEGAEDDEFECNMEGVPVDRSNLVLRAVDVFREHTGVARKFKIRLEKTVPAQAGLGGGSGNCSANCATSASATTIASARLPTLPWRRN